MQIYSKSLKPPNIWQNKLCAKRVQMHRFCSPREMTKRLNMDGSRYGVVARAAPGVATQQTANGEVEALERAVLQDGLTGVLATGGRKAAGGTEQRGDG